MMKSDCVLKSSLGFIFRLADPLFRLRIIIFRFIGSLFPLRSFPFWPVQM
ncbi:hypothetical protein YC2023_117724 [Brassica napus]